MRRPERGTLIRWGGVVLLVAAWLLLRWGGDRWWPAMPLLYGPRFVLAPLVLLPLIGLRGRNRTRSFARRLLAPLLVGGVAFALLIDVRLPWRAWIAPHDETIPVISVLTWNAAGGGGDAAAAARWVGAQHPDLALVTECTSGLARELDRLPAVEFRQSADLCFLTTRPVLDWAPRPPDDFWEAGGAGAIARLVIDVHGRPVVVGGVHLETPREALEALAKGALFSFRRDAGLSVHERDVESAAARAWIRPAEEQRPTVVMGDFNLVRESAIYRRWWGDLINAFGTAGTGLGWTKWTAFFGARIDHVLTGGGARPRSARVGPELGSDHRPLLVDVAIPGVR